MHFCILRECAFPTVQFLTACSELGSFKSCTVIGVGLSLFEDNLEVLVGFQYEVFFVQTIAHTFTGIAGVLRHTGRLNSLCFEIGVAGGFAYDVHTIIYIDIIIAANVFGHIEADTVK